jgi:integrase
VVCGRSFTPHYNTGRRAKVCPDPKCKAKYKKHSGGNNANVALDPRRFLSEDEFQRFVKRTYKRPDGLALRFIAGTGCRVGESVLVRPEDLHLDTDKPLVRMITLKRKTRPVRSVLLFDKTLVAELKAHAKDAPQGEALFDVSVRTLEDRFEQILKDLNLYDKKDGNTHLMRHTRASQLARAGFTPHEIAQQMGWASLQMAMRYTHSDVDSMFERSRNLPPAGRGRKR